MEVQVTLNCLALACNLTKKEYRFLKGLKLHLISWERSKVKGIKVSVHIFQMLFQMKCVKEHLFEY